MSPITLTTNKIGLNHWLASSIDGNVMVRFDFSETLRWQRPDFGLTWYKSNASFISPHAVHLPFPIIHIISHRIYHFFYPFKVNECRRKLYGTDVYHQLMSKFHVRLINVKWMKATAWKLISTHLNFLVYKLLLYTPSLNGRHFAFYVNQLSLLYCFSYLTSKLNELYNS